LKVDRLNNKNLLTVKGSIFMSKRSKYTAEEKYQIIKAYEDGVGSVKEITSQYVISVTTFYNWRYNS
ncbi:transposase, partial [Desulfosporosinus sp. OT]|uniref:transposase n=1 Tax=Desulfosporosinus sp. OT TaxID=913865 RepID=UPI0011118E77